MNIEERGEEMMFECLTSFFKKSKDRNQYFYVIVHDVLVPRFHPARLIIDRIKQTENFIEVHGDSRKIPSGIPLHQPIRVCGAYRSLCVRDQCDALRSAGYHVSVYFMGTVG